MRRSALVRRRQKEKSRSCLSLFPRRTRMERELWRRIISVLKRVARTRPRNAVYTDRQIAAVFFWAVLHDRPVSWACDRRHWPMQAWRRELPDQSTMSRRLRRGQFAQLLRTLLKTMQSTLGRSEILVVDGKPLELSEHTRDPEATSGRGAGRYAKGYKLHVVLDAHTWAVIDHRVHSLNVSEITAATTMMRGLKASMASGAILLGDRLFDSNVLHAAAARRGCQLIAPRKRPNTGLGSRRHHPHRLESIRFTEGIDRQMWDDVLGPQRTQIERYFGMLSGSLAGLTGLPPWVRRLHRVRLWVTAKLVINAARIARRRHVAA